MKVDLARRLLLDEAARRGYAAEVLFSHPLNLIRISRDGAGFIFLNWPGCLSMLQRDDRYRLHDKPYQKRLMHGAGLPVPETLQIVRHPVQLQWHPIAWPVVCKPRIGAGSRLVTANIRGVADLVAAVTAVTGRGQECLIERHVPGRHYRMLVIWQRYVSCVERRPASIRGDGVRTVLELVAERNAEPLRGAPDDVSTPLNYITWDETAARAAAAQGYSADSVVAEGDVVTLDDTHLAGRCGDLVDVTDEVHPETIRRCEQFAAAQDLALVGFDFITRDIGQPCSREGAFNEINLTNPDLGLNECCNVGQPRPVSKAVWDGVAFDAVCSPAYPEF